MVESGEITQEEIDVFWDLHERLENKGLMP